MKAANKNINGDNISLLVSLNDLIDDMEYENNENSDMYQEKGEIYDKEKIAWDLKGNSAGRYTNKYIHYIMKNEYSQKFIKANENNTTLKSNKNGK